MTPKNQVAEQRQEGQGPPNMQLSAAGPQTHEARLHHDTGPEVWMGGYLPAREGLWAFPGQVVP